MRRIRPVRLVVAVLLAIVGVIWLGQGLGILAGTVMSGSAIWAVVGAVLLAVAALIAVRELRQG